MLQQFPVPLTVWRVTSKGLQVIPAAVVIGGLVSHHVAGILDGHVDSVWHPSEIEFYSKRFDAELEIEKLS